MAESLRVVTVTTSYPRWDGDFAGHFIASLAEELAREGHQMIVVAPHDPGAPERETRNGVDVRRVRYGTDRAERLAYGDGIVPNLRGNPLRAGAAPALARALRAGVSSAVDLQGRRADIIHAHWGPTALLTGAQRAGVPVLLTLHGSEVTLAGRRPGLWRALLRRSLRAADAVGVVAASQEAIVREQCGYTGPLQVVPSGVPVELVHRARPAVTPGPFTFVFVGRLVREKGIRELLESFSALVGEGMDVRLRIAGNGELETMVRSRADQAAMAGRIEVLGELPHDAALEMIAAADALVLPSHGEGSPLSVTEALALGTPVIASDVGGLPELVEDAGRLVPAGDVAALIVAMREMVEQPERRAEMAASGRERIERTRTWPAVANSTLGLYAEAIDAYVGRRS